MSEDDKPRRRFGWTLVCPKCYDKPGHYFGILKIPSERVAMECPNCGARLVDVERLRAELVSGRGNGGR